MKYLKNKINFFKNNFAFVFTFALFSIVNILILFSVHELDSGSADSARYFFSAIAQSQAAIVAIVITLTLVAVQLTSQTYTPRIMDLFLKSKMFWSLLFLYSISIIYDVAVLAIIPQSLDNLSDTVVVYGIEPTFNTFVMIGLILIMSAFLFLFIFIRDVIKQLKPEEIIERLVKATDIEEIKLTAQCDLVDDPLLPIKEIGRVALNSGDELTTLKVIIEMDSMAEKIIGDWDFVKSKTPKEVLEEVYAGISNSIELEKDNTSLDNHIVSYFTTFFSDLAHISLQRNSITLFKNIVASLGNIGILLSNKKSNIAIYILSELKEMEKLVQEKGFANDIDVLSQFQKVSLKAAKNRLWDVVEYSNGIIGLFIAEYNERDLKYSDEDIIYGGDVSGSLRPFVIIDSIKDIGKCIVKSIPNIEGNERFDGDEDFFKGLIEINSAISNLNMMAEIAIKKRWESIMQTSVHAIIGICKSLIHKGGENLYHPINPTVLLSESLEKIATSSTNSEVYYETKQMLPVLEKCAEYLVDKSYRNASVVTNSLINIYKFVYMHHCKGNPCDMILGAPDSLGDIGKITMIYDTKFLMEEESQGYHKPTTQKIIDAIEEIGINASNSNYPESSWIYVAENAAKHIIFFATQYVQSENEEVAKYLIQKLKNMDELYIENVGHLIDDIILQIEKKKTWGLHDKDTDENGFLKLNDINVSDFKAFSKFKELYNDPY